MNKKILIVNNKEIKGKIEKFLNTDSCKIEYAFDCQTALDKIRINDYDLILIDHIGGGTNGTNIIENFYRIKPALKNMIIQTYGTNDVVNKAENFVVYDHIGKDKNINDLAVKIKEMLSENNMLNLVYYACS